MRRTVRLMVVLPLVVAGGAAVYLLAGVGLWFLLGNTTLEGARIVMVVLMGLLGTLLLVQCLVWMTAILSRVSLQTVLGEGFAPARGTVTLRSALALFLPMLGLSALQYVALSVLQTAIGILYYAVLIGVLVSGVDSEAALGVLSVVLSLVTALAAALGYGYLSLTVPAFAAESRLAPGWIGKPARPTTVLTTFLRSVRLVGRPNVLRVAGIYAATAGICLGLITLVAVGALMIVTLFATSISYDVQQVLSSPWTLGSVAAFSVLVALSGLLAYLAAVQALLYLDLRMRREGLDLAMRFDAVPVPQPSAPPPVWAPHPGPGR